MDSQGKNVSSKRRRELVASEAWKCSVCEQPIKFCECRKPVELWEGPPLWEDNAH